LNECFLGIDIGTTACKTILFTADGRIVAKATTEYSVQYPKPDWAEQDPDVWWNATRTNISAILKKAGRSQRLIGIGVDSQREAVVAIDSRGKKLGNSLIWLDRRTIPTAQRMAKLLSPNDVLRITGVPMDYFYSAPKMLWLKEAHQRLFEKTTCFLFPKDYVTFKLTGQKSTDPSMASRTMLFDIVKRKWSEKICYALDIDVGLLPQVVGSSEVVGEVTARGASLTGLRAGTPVVSGGGDRPCESLGAGVTGLGQFNIGTGTATCITTPLTTPTVDMNGHVDCCCHVIPNMWEHEIVIITTGASLRWFRDAFCSEEVERSKKTGVDPYVYLDNLAANVKAGSDGLLFYPYPLGSKAPKFNDHAKGVFFGITLSHTKAHAVRSIFEGIAFQYAEAIGLEEDFGIKVKEASIVGGEARSNLWNQIKTNVLARPVRRPRVEEAAALGSAILASVGTGTNKTLGRAVDQMVTLAKTYRPQGRAVATYRTVYKRYQNVYHAIENGYAVYSGRSAQFG
jgi:xylulokinase